MTQLTSLGSDVVPLSKHGGALKFIPPPFSNDSDLKVYWKFDESSGDIINKSKAAADLGAPADIQISGATYDQTPFGAFGRSILWDGVDDFGTVGSSVSQFNFLHNTSGHWSICFWYKLISVTGDYCFFNTADNVAATVIGTLIEKRSGGNARKVELTIGNGTALDAMATSDTFLPNNLDWHFLVITFNYSSGVASFIVDNGTPVTDTRGTTYSNSNASSVMWTAKAKTGEFFGGNYQEFSIWDRILTADEITELYNSGAGLAIY